MGLSLPILAEEGGAAILQCAIQTLARVSFGTLPAGCQLWQEEEPLTSKFLILHRSVRLGLHFLGL